MTLQALIIPPLCLEIKKKKKKKIRDTKGTFHAKMGSIKDRNGKDLTSRR